MWEIENWPSHDLPNTNIGPLLGALPREPYLESCFKKINTCGTETQSEDLVWVNSLVLVKITFFDESLNISIENQSRNNVTVQVDSWYQTCCPFQSSRCHIEPTTQTNNSTKIVIPNHKQTTIWHSQLLLLLQQWL